MIQTVLDRASTKASAWRSWVRRVLQAESTILAHAGLPMFGRYGYFVPYARAGEHPRAGPDDTVSWLEERLEEGLAMFLEQLTQAERLSGRLVEFASGDSTDPNQPRFDQSWFSGIDAAMLYSMVYCRRPARVSA